MTWPAGSLRRLALLLGFALGAGGAVRLLSVPAAPPAVSAPAAIRVTVAADGTGDFRTVQQAIDHAPAEGRGRLIVRIEPGTYRERVRIPESRPRVSFVGLGKHASDTVITYSMSATEAGGTFFSSTVDAQGAGFEASHLTIENSYGPGSQAVALSLESDRAVLRDCRLIGWQDTLYAESGRQYYDRCFIRGAVDFIFGDARAVFDRCTIESAGRGYVTAEGRATADGPGGYVFYRTKLIGAPGVNHVYLGRPWRPYARVVFLDCWLGGQILPEGWDNWHGTNYDETAWFGEYDSSGPGAALGQRVPWAKKLTKAAAAAFLPRAFLAGKDGWDPTARH